MTETLNIAAMSTPQAELRLAELQANEAWATRLMSGDAAARGDFDALAHKIAGLPVSAPPAPDSHQGRLNSFTSDPSTAARLFAGDADTVRRFRELTEAAHNSEGSGGDPLLDVVIGSDTSHTVTAAATAHDISAADKLDVIRMFRAEGLSDEHIIEAFYGAPAKPADVAKVRALHSRLTNDAEWVAKLMKGGAEQKRELRLMSIILAAA
jgi:hypothetical protein